jgi:hypothetical protein
MQRTRLLWALLLLAPLAAHGQTYSDGGHLVTFCLTGTNATVEVANLNSGLVVASSLVRTTNDLISNTMSSSIDTANMKFALGANQSPKGSLTGVHIYSYSGTSATFERMCTAPDTVFAGNTRPGDMYCVVYSEARLFAIYDESFGTGIVAEVNANCSYTTLGKSPLQPKGSKNGPGGQCVAMPGLSKIAWMDNDSNKLVVFDYQSMVFSQTTVTGFDNTATFAGFAQIMGLSDSIILVFQSDYYLITGFPAANSASMTSGTVTAFAGKDGTSSSDTNERGHEGLTLANFKITVPGNGIYGRDSSFSFVKTAAVGGSNLPYFMPCINTGGSSTAISQLDYNLKVAYTVTPSTSPTAPKTTPSPVNAPSTGSNGARPQAVTVALAVLLLSSAALF